MSMRALPGLTMAELTCALESRARAVKLLKWLYAQRPLPERLPETLPDINQRLWRIFSQKHGLISPRTAERSTGEDGTTKYVLQLQGAAVEAVRIPSKTRSTICISSQSGCSRRCHFCATPRLGFIRQLKAEEMVAQYMLVRAQAPAHQPASNVVFMGMGEPFDNLEEVLRAIELLTQSPAPMLSAASVTVSTSGVLPGLRRFLRESKASLALSLHATTDAVRAQLMPQNRIWPIAALLEELRTHTPRTRDVFIEYVLFDGVNDSDVDADRLARLLYGIPSRINLIPFNSYPGASFRTPSAARVVHFYEKLRQQGALCLVRWPRGRDIAAACGQLALVRNEAA